jgi:hypothetical protein
MIGVQSLESVLPEALLPTNDGGRRGLELALDGVERRPPASIRIDLARNTYPAGKSRDWAMLLRSECCCLVSKISLPLAMTA